MKNILITIALAATIISCSTDQPIDPTIYNAKITNHGGSPECFITHNGLTRKYNESVVNTEIFKGDVITVIGQSYSIDNQYNYGAANVNVVANISITVNNKEVKTGINNLTFQL